MEYKRGGEKPTLKQQAELDDYNARGIPAFWTDNVDTAIHIIKVMTSYAKDPANPKHRERTLDKLRAYATS